MKKTVLRHCATLVLAAGLGTMVATPASAHGVLGIPLPSTFVGYGETKKAALEDARDNMAKASVEDSSGRLECQEISYQVAPEKRNEKLTYKATVQANCVRMPKATDLF